MPQITSEQDLMRENARRLFAAPDGLARVRRSAEDWPGVDKKVWREFAAAGWLSLLLPEDKGGMGGNAIDFVTLMEGLGDLLPPEPVAPALTTVPLLAACVTEPAQIARRGAERRTNRTCLDGRAGVPVRSGAPADSRCALGRRADL